MVPWETRGPGIARAFAALVLIAAVLAVSAIVLGGVGIMVKSTRPGITGLWCLAGATLFGMIAAALSGAVRCDDCGATMFGVLVHRNVRGHTGSVGGLLRILLKGQVLCRHCERTRALAIHGLTRG